MITDRTSSDVALAKVIRLKMQAQQALTDAEKAQLERGACTITMLNRINSKISDLESALNALAYRVAPTKNTVAKSYADIFTAEEYSSIFESLNKLKQAFYIYSETPQTPEYMYGYLEANNIEQILVDIETMLTDMKDKFRQCGTFQCGEENEN